MHHIDTGRLSRRDIVAALAGTMALSACGVTSGGSSSNLVSLGSPVAAGGTSEVAIWTALAGTPFGAGGYGLTLASVEAQPVQGARPADLRQTPFVAAFDVTRGAVPTDATYRLTSAATNPFEVFLTASPTVANRVYALFN